MDQEEVQEEEPTARAARRIRPARPAPPDTAPADLAARYARGASGRRVRLALAALCAVVCTLVSVDLPVLAGWEAEWGQAAIGDLRLGLLAGMLLLTGLLCTDVVGRGMASLCLLRPGLETLPTLAFLFTLADALAMLERTGCDGISVGRGAQGRPWIFRDIVAAYHGGSIPPGPSLAEVVSVIERHAAWCVVDQGDEGRALRAMRKHIGWYLRGFAVGGPQRHALSMVSTLQELHERLADLDLDQEFPPAARGPSGRAGSEKTPHLPDGWLDNPYLTDAERLRLHLAEIG